MPASPISWLSPQLRANRSSSVRASAGGPTGRPPRISADAGRVLPPRAPAAAAVAAADAAAAAAAADTASSSAAAAAVAAAAVV